MIVEFSVENFGSIKERQVLSFEADSSRHLEETYVVNFYGHRLLKLALIYGANASGKTTILRALDFLRSLVLEPESKKTSALDFQPFLFDVNTPKEPSIISIVFIHNSVKYNYEVVFLRNAVLEEKLYFYNPKKAKVYERKTDLSKQYASINFGSKILGDAVFKKQLEANTLWNNTVLGGYLKTNIDLEELQEVIYWFREYLRPMVYTESELTGFVTANIQSGAISKTNIVSILKKADFNISDIIIREEEQEVPNDFFGFLKEKGVPDSRIEELQKKNKITAVNLELQHNIDGKRYTLPFELESEGTKRFYGFAGLLAILLNNSVAIPIDELESSLHPELYIHFLLSFLVNSKNSQLIATTHNREILDNRDIFRNDAIWFTDKLENCATEIYSLADFDSSTVRNTTNVLNAYKSGKLSGTPNLGDIYIDLNNGQE